MEEAVLKILKSGKETAQLPIPFRPSSLRMYTSGEYKKKKDSQKGKKTLKNRRSEQGIRLDLHLVLDRSIQKISVREDTECLLNAMELCSADTKVEFAWGKQSFRGILEKVSGVYQMFDKNGEPVRAALDMTIACRDESWMEMRFGQSYQRLSR